MSDKQHITNESAIFSLWLNWAVAVGALALPEFLGLYVPKIWIPILVLGIMFLLIAYRNTGGKLNAASCDLIQMICIRTLGISAVVMLLIAVAYVRGYVSMFYSPAEINTDIPFSPFSSKCPVAVIICVAHLILGNNSSVCRRCIIRYGTSSERGFLGRIFLQESRYQLRFLLILAAALSVFCWVYYWLYYINVNLNRFDRFVFNWIPVIFFGLSIIYLGMRYFSIWSYYYNYIELNPRRRATTTTVRYIILCGDSVFLNRTEDFNDIPDANRFDTPAEILFQSRDHFSDCEASRVLTNMSDLQPDKFNIRFMYKSTDTSGLSNTLPLHLLPRVARRHQVHHLPAANGTPSPSFSASSPTASLPRSWLRNSTASTPSPWYGKPTTSTVAASIKSKTTAPTSASAASATGT